MRWPFGRSSTPTDGSAKRAQDSGTDPPSVRPYDAWRSLPVVQRVVGAPPTVAPTRPFADSLATRQVPALALEPLGHEISPLASPGLVAGVATPVGAAHSGRVDLPLQRAIEREPGVESEAAGWSSFEATGPVPSSPGTPPGDRPATAQSPVRPVIAQRLAASEPILTTSTATTVPAAPAGTLDLRPAGPAVAELPHTSALPQARASDAVPGVAESGRATSEPPLRRPTLGQARRLGLGAPIGSALSSAVQRDVTPASGSGVPAGDRLSVALPALGMLAGAPADQATTSTPVGSSPLPAGLAGAAIDAAPVEHRSSEPGLLPVVRPISIQRLVAVDPIGSRASWTGEPGAVLAAERPLVVVPAGSSAAAQPRDPGQTDPGQADPGPLGTWSGPAAIAPNDGPGADAAALISPLGGGPMRVSSAGSLLKPAAGGAGNDPVRTTPSVRSSVGEAVVARSVADASRIATAGGLASSRTASGFEGVRRSEPAGPVVMRTIARTSVSTTGSEPGTALQQAASAMPVQRAIQINEVEIRPAVTEPAAGNGAGAGQGERTGTGPAAAASPADRDRELDELARRLYGRIRSRLSAELLADRERAGMITDLR